jgi:hypothetical protein
VVIVIILIVLGVLVLGGGLLAVMAIYGTRKYIANAKTAEARSYLLMMGKDAASAYENEGTDPLANPGSGSLPRRRLCPSGQPVPRDLSAVGGKKYQSTRSDWTDNAGWQCLRFEILSPQYYQYRFDNTGAGFSGVAQGDLNGDGVPSKFELVGKLQNDTLILAPTIIETNPDE